MKGHGRLELKWLGGNVGRRRERSRGKEQDHASLTMGSAPGLGPGWLRVSSKGKGEVGE